MKKIFSKSMLFVTVLLKLFGCQYVVPITGSDKIIETHYEFSNFSAIDVANNFEVNIIQSNDYKVIIRYNDNLKEYLKITNENGILEISLVNGHNYNKTKLYAEVYVPDLEKLRANGASNVQIEEFKNDKMKIELSGASQLNGKLNIKNSLIVVVSGASNFKSERINSNTITINASGASNIDLSGTTKKATVQLSGASELNGKSMEIETELQIDCSGASVAVVTTQGIINAELSGASSLDYYGNGTIAKQDVSGASSINKH